MKLAKLDGYDYEVIGSIIRIQMVSSNDPDIGDIMSEIRLSDMIYLEGMFLEYQDYRIIKEGENVYLDLFVHVNHEPYKEEV